MKACDIPRSQPEYYLNTDTKLAGNILNPGFHRYLETFYSKAALPEDRAMCLELLTALDISAAVKGHKNVCPSGGVYIAKQNVRRPFTAYGQIDLGFDPYMTSHKRDFITHEIKNSQGCRPRSSLATYHSPTRQPQNRTTYEHEFYDKRQPRIEPIRSGTASGVRRNNPHPLQAFMVWKLSPDMMHQRKENLEVEAADKAIDKALKGKLMSVYQKDYLGLPNGCRPIVSSPLIQDSNEQKIPRTINTTTRLAYQEPMKLTPELQVPLTRFASAMVTNKNSPATGTVPGSSGNVQMNMRVRTSYEQDYTDPHGKNPRPRSCRQLGQYYVADALQRHLQNTDIDESKDLNRVLRCLDVQSTVHAPSPPFGSSSRILQGHRPTRVPQATAITIF